MDWTSRVRATFGYRSVPDDDVIEELAQHAAAAFEAARADGCDAADADRRVQDQIAAWTGDPALLTRRPRRAPAVEPPPATMPVLAGLAGDARYAVQVLRRQWRHALVVVLTLALGIGATTLLFSVAYGVLARPMPWPGADRLVRLYETRQGSTRPATFMTNATYLAWAERPATIDALAAWSVYPATLTEVGAPERVRIVEASPSLFVLLGSRPAVGRPFGVTAAGSADPAQVILSHDLWQRRFGSSREAIGRVLRLDGIQHRVVGIMPAGFGFPDREAQAYIPFNVPPAAVRPNGRGTLSMFSALGRLRPGATATQAAAEGTARGRAAPDPGLVTIAVFGTNGPVQVSVVPLVESMTGEVRPALLIFLAAVGLLLAVATANVASLQLARATVRRREMAIRGALGAGGARLTRQLLVENVIVGQIGGIAGLLLAAGLIDLLPGILPPDFPRVSDVTLDWRVALFAAGVSLASSVAFGLAPAMQARRVDLVASLAEDGLAPVGGGSRSGTARARLAIMAGQVAVASVLLVGAALLARSFVALVHADRGFQPSNLLTAHLSLPDGTYTPQRRAEVLERVMTRVRTTPGVTAAAYATRLPLGSGGEILAAFPVPARTGAGTVSAHASIRQVSPEYFAALGVRVVEGRGFTARDTIDSGEVVIVNRAFAKQYLDAPAVGVRMPGSVSPREVIGVIDDIKYGSASDAAQPELYQVTRQLHAGFEFDSPAVLVRTSGDPRRLAPILRAAVREQDPSAALESVMTMDDRVWTSLAKPRLYAVLLGGFAFFALAIAGVGLFGVLSYTVSLRSREIGVRASLGATPWDIAALVLRQALIVTAGGLAVGLILSAALGRYLSRLLYGVTAWDPVSFVAVPALLSIVALVACIVPARRAARVDPVRVLR